MAQQDDEFVSTAMTADRYVSTMLSSVEGHKVLLVDDAVRAIFNAITTHSSLLSHSVLLVDKIFNPDRQPMKYMPAIAILRPTADSMAAISREIREGTFREFHLFFTNLVLTEHLQSIANCDDGGLVKRVEEVFLDFTPVTENSVVIPLKREFSLEGGKTVLKPHIPLTINQWSPGEINRVVEGLVATMLACQRRPTIRYRRGSQIAARLASELSVKMKTVNSVFFDLRRHSTVLLILDRMDDPVTPLLTQWTYEAMMHEHFGINDGVVDLGGGTNETKHVLSKHHDSFWSSHRDKVWGELCVAVKNLVEAYKKAGSIDVATASLQDIEAFMAKFPQFKKDNAVMTRHASIAHKLGALVQERALIDLSTIEQELANNNAPNDHARLVLDCIRSLKGETVDTTVTNEDTGRGVVTSSKAALSPERPESDYLVSHDDAVKLVILYSLRYEKVAKAEPLVAEMKSVLRSRGATDAHLDLIRKFLEYSSVASRIAPLYKNQTNLLKTMVKTIAGFGSDVQNVFTSHVPLMKKFVCQAFNGTLLTDDFPIQEVSGISSVSNSLGRANDIIVFYAGGATYEEAVLANNINSGKAENDSSTFPQTDSMIGAGAVGVVGNALGAAVKGLVKAAGTQGADDVVGPATAIPEAPPKFLTCKVTLVSNGMLRQREFMASVGAL